VDQHQALPVRQLTSDLMLITNTVPALADEQAEELGVRDVRLVGGRVKSFEVIHDHVTGVRPDDGTVVARQRW
jgi:hypothetical protein